MDFHRPFVWRHNNQSMINVSSSANSDGFIDNPADTACLLFKLFIASHLSGPHFPHFHPSPRHCTASSHLTGRGNIASDDFPYLKARGLFLDWKQFSPRNIHASIRSKVNLLLHLYHSWIYPFDLTGKEVAGWTPQWWETVSGSFLSGKCSEHLHKDRFVRQRMCFSRFHRTHAADRWGGRGHQELSSFYSENRMVTLASVITFHVIWVSPVSITFLFGWENSTFRLTTSTSIKVTRRNTIPGGLNPNTLSPICLLSVNSDLHECVGVHIYLTIYTLYYIAKRILGNLENYLNVRRLYDLKMG